MLHKCKNEKGKKAKAFVSRIFARKTVVDTFHIWYVKNAHSTSL